MSTDAGGTAGGGLSYLGVDRPSSTLLVANFEAGLAVSLPIRRNGGLGAPVSVVADTGSGPSPRQLGPHPRVPANVLESSLEQVDWLAKSSMDAATWNTTTAFIDAKGALPDGAKVTTSDWTNKYLP